MFLRQFLVSFAALILLAASGAFLCTRMGSVPMAGMGGLMQADHMMMDCGVFMETFFQSISVSSVNTISNLTVVGIFMFFIFLLCTARRTDPIKQHIKQFFRRLHFSFHPPALVLALSQGIIHPKRYS